MRLQGFYDPEDVWFEVDEATSPGRTVLWDNITTLEDIFHPKALKTTVYVCMCACICCRCNPHGDVTEAVLRVP